MAVPLTTAEFGLQAAATPRTTAITSHIRTADRDGTSAGPEAFPTFKGTQSVPCLRLRSAPCSDAPCNERIKQEEIGLEDSRLSRDSADVAALDHTRRHSNEEGDDPPVPRPEPWNGSPITWRFSRRHTTSCLLRRFVDAHLAGTLEHLPPKSLVLTFDDGHRGNYAPRSLLAGLTGARRRSSSVAVWSAPATILVPDGGGLRSP